MQVLADAGEADFALPEAVVVALSVEYFNDPEPCEIHRGAVRHRAVQELRERCPLGQAVAVSALDEGLRRLLPEGAATVLFSEEGP